ncbi:hypothetical protein HYPSUDRAFT_448808 [Hypholoma sublateritium FD-334 SS-4]|uniref:Uncharacterized protein n=1 Tax=Hypholoma sublateritium (strain FD-334 SS-4) TaxID=945553 RepID=A0A0D2MLS4_HYPSF|nr:hypothetical protein HYPSUDRAFT_448808 [Hypholoma sublateritium FD-334 SS-4]
MTPPRRQYMSVCATLTHSAGSESLRTSFIFIFALASCHCSSFSLLTPVFYPHMMLGLRQ